MRGGVAVQRDHPRGSMSCRRMGKEPLGGGHITPFAQEKINRSTLFIDRAIEVNPLALYLDVGLIHAPGVAHSPPRLLQSLGPCRWACAILPVAARFRAHRVGIELAAGRAIVA